jgi:hypothetical protein
VFTSTDTRASPSPFAFVDQSSLLLVSPSSPTSTPKSQSAQSSSEDDSATAAPVPAAKASSDPSSPPSFPSTWPSRIVPPGADLDPPPNTTLASILFNQTLSWQTLIQNPDLVAQIYGYMPQLCANALGISTDQVTTSSLLAFQPADYTPQNQDMKSVWLGYVPDKQVDSLASMLKDPGSPLYHQPQGLEAQLANQIDPSMDIRSYDSDPSVNPNANNNNASSANDANSASDSNSPSSGGSSKKTTTTVAAVCGSFGAVLFLVGASIGARALRKRRAQGVRLSGNGSGSARGAPDPGSMRQVGLNNGGGRPFSDESFGHRTPSFDSADGSFRGYGEAAAGAATYATANPGGHHYFTTQREAPANAPAHHAVEVHGQALGGGGGDHLLMPVDPFAADVGRESAWSAWSSTSDENAHHQQHRQPRQQPQGGGGLQPQVAPPHPRDHHHHFATEKGSISYPIPMSNSYVLGHDPP